MLLGWHRRQALWVLAESLISCTMNYKQKRSGGDQILMQVGEREVKVHARLRCISLMLFYLGTVQVLVLFKQFICLLDGHLVVSIVKRI